MSYLPKSLHIGGFIAQSTGFPSFEGAHTARTYEEAASITCRGGTFSVEDPLGVSRERFVSSGDFPPTLYQ